MRYPVLGLSLLLTACATGTAYDGRVTISTASNGQELAGANCVVNTDSGSWRVTTPATLAIGSGNGDLHVVCSKAGFTTAELLQPPYGQSGSSAGLGMGGGSGNVGFGLGFQIPIASSGGRYPAHIVINMNPLQGAD